MNFEIHKPELEHRVREGIRSGRFRDADELIGKALDAIFEKEAAARPPISPPGQTTGRTTFEHGLGLFSSPDNAALLDEVVSTAYAERHWPTRSLSAL